MQKRFFKYHEPSATGEDLTIIKSSEDIMRDFYSDWKNRMISLGRKEMASFNNCIDDWMAVNWAIEITEEDANRVSQKQQLNG